MFPVIIKPIQKSTKIWKAIIVISFVLIYSILVQVIPLERYHAILYISPIVRITDFVFGIFLALSYLSLKDNCQVRTFMEKYGKFSFWVIIGIIVLLVIESSLIPKDIRRIAPIYWPLIGSLIFIVSLTENGGGQILTKQMAFPIWRNKFYLFSNASVGDTLRNEIV